MKKMAMGRRIPSCAPNIRFALMDAEITDLTSSGAAEMVVGPVVFENFVLDHPGRWGWLI